MKTIKTILSSMFITLMISMSSSVKAEDTIRQSQEVLQIKKLDDNTKVGKASFYKYGSKTASGEKFNKNALTCAHMSLPFNTMLRVTNIKTGDSVVVRVTDRGNFAKLGREIDLSEGAFKKIAPLKQGVVKVKIEKI